MSSGDPAMTPEAILAIHQHRPWPLPQRPWAMRMEWQRLLFAHWAFPPDRLRPLVPPALELDARDGRCWVAVTPFYLEGLRMHPRFRFPATFSFPELNLRTYVRHEGKAGVYFLSLDVGSWMAAIGARLLYSLPYFHAHMRMRVASASIHYVSLARHRGRRADFEADYATIGPAFTPAPGSLEHFLVERYCLFTVRGSGVYRTDIHHAPWSLQPARATIAMNTVAEAEGIDLPRHDQILHYAHRMGTLVWSPERVG